MNLAEMLSYADIADLSKIAQNYDCDCNANSKKELIQSILLKVNHRDHFAKQIQEWGDEDIRLINLLAFYPRTSLSLEDLLARINQTHFSPKEDSQWNPREIIRKFKQRGWLFNGHSQQTKYLFQLPCDLKSKFAEALTIKFKEQMQFLDDDPAVYRDEQSLLLGDIQLFLKFVLNHPVQLSAEGYMYKRAVQQIIDSFAVMEKGVVKSAWRFGYGRRFKEYPQRFSFIYDYCFYHELIIETESELLLSEKGIKTATGGKEEDIREVYKFWLKLYKGAVPNLQVIVQWIERLAKPWVISASISEVLCPLIKPFFYDSAESIFRARIVPMLMHLGMLRIGEDQSRGAVLQISSLGSKLIQGLNPADHEDIDNDKSFLLQSLLT